MPHWLVIHSTECPFDLCHCAASQEEHTMQQRTKTKSQKHKRMGLIVHTNILFTWQELLWWWWPCMWYLIRYTCCSLNVTTVFSGARGLQECLAYTKLMSSQATKKAIVAEKAELPSGWLTAGVVRNSRSTSLPEWSAYIFLMRTPSHLHLFHSWLTNSACNALAEPDIRSMYFSFSELALSWRDLQLACHPVRLKRNLLSGKAEVKICKS